MQRRKKRGERHTFASGPTAATVLSLSAVLAVHACGGRTRLEGSLTGTTATAGTFANTAGAPSSASGGSSVTMGGSIAMAIGGTSPNGAFGGAAPIGGTAAATGGAGGAGDVCNNPSTGCPAGTSCVSGRCLPLQTNPDLTHIAARTFTTGNALTSIVLGDWNGDGLVDVATANSTDSSVSALLGKGDGNFAPRVDYMVGAAPYSLATCDLNKDKKADLVSANRGDGTVAVLLGKGDGTFSTDGLYLCPNGGSGRAIACADLNDDGIADVAVLNNNGMLATVSVLLGTGTGKLAAKVDYSTAANPTAIAIGDLNHDGMPDVVTGNYNPAHVSVLLGKGDGTLAPHVDRKDPTDGTRSIAIADLNGDGDADLGIGDAEGRGPPGNFGMNPGNGDGTFEAEISYPPVISGCEVAAGDLDADGRLDLIGTTSRGLGILFGLAGGKLVRGADFRLEHSGTCALAAGDLNGDKRLDVVVKEGPNQISSWLGVGDGTFR